ncbi:hypothetical protein [Streptosporangium carneum]|uniref:Uncharacterized protein n=1 Tax=Streptosporangium carneum TaxID=47481 RepID=A0A9W6MB88_9ACTN|nr:hypothetical protein [Streptosporangium carneum]GLK07408.1 hypothetical protein GCM10017600_08130 [Streptosporangium carneum]
MSQLIEKLQEVITVERSQFLLEDQDGILDEPDGWPRLEELAARLPENSWFEATLNEAIFWSEAPWHDIKVTLELWDGPPPEDTSHWTRSKNAPFYSSSGIIYLSKLFDSNSPLVPMDLRKEASEWVIRASSRPGSGWIWPDEESPPSGIEEWRIQFWPAKGINLDLAHIPHRKTI